ncbi:LamG-like jellyroll fold domain-containing protein, partial [Mariniflexile sp. HMF6888]|uniref:LamG-like jellyroll fold domain-containing protein n=1 Tax=Mariniflexile sp. HMF6888 TaxID=3373086 RepID=UPI00379CD9D9
MKSIIKSNHKGVPQKLQINKHNKSVLVKKLILICLLISVFVGEAQNFSGWNRKQAITIDQNQVPGTSDLIDFPFLVTLDYLDSEIVDGGANSALNGGGDIRFSSDAAGNNRLAVEIVEFITDASLANRKCQIWVKIPNLSATSNTTIYVWYNKAGEAQPAATDVYGSQNVWINNNYVSIWHLDENATSGILQIKDSGENSNDGVSKEIMDSSNSVISKVGGGINLKGTNFFNVGNNTSLNLTANLTISGWFKPNKLHDFYVMAKRSETVVNGYNILPQLQGFVSYYDGSSIPDSGLNYNINEWNYIVVKLNSSGTGVTIFLNGNFSSEMTVIAPSDGLAQNLYLGSRSNGAFGKLDGAIDELRVSNTFRSDEWISTEYNNMSNPSAFAVAGTPESAIIDTQAPTAPTLSSAVQTDTTVDLSWTA